MFGSTMLPRLRPACKRPERAWGEATRSSKMRNFAAAARPFLLEVNVSERLPVGVADDEAGVGLLDGSGRRESAAVKLNAPAGR
jgi:hypothetical protein